MPQSKPPGINWEAVKAATSKKGRRGIVTKQTELEKVNEAISKLITLKKRYVYSNEPRQKGAIIQKEIDILLKRKRVILEVEKFMEWKRKKGVQ